MSPRMTLNLMPNPTSDLAFYVGLVRMNRCGRGFVQCAICSDVISANRAAQHAQKKHPKDAQGVLPGQLGMLGTPDVPR